MSVSGWITTAKVKEILNLDNVGVVRLIRTGKLHPVKACGKNVYRENEVRCLASERAVTRSGQ